MRVAFRGGALVKRADFSDGRVNYEALSDTDEDKALAAAFEQHRARSGDPADGAELEFNGTSFVNPAEPAAAGTTGSAGEGDGEED